LEFKDTAVIRIVIGSTICLTPPLGWNSWNCFQKSIDDGKIRGAADAMVATGLIDHGWTYINMDDRWEGDRDAQGNIQSSKLRVTVLTWLLMGRNCSSLRPANSTSRRADCVRFFAAPGRSTMRFWRYPLRRRQDPAAAMGEGPTAPNLLTKVGSGGP
jgi:Alpha galactosidase A